MVRRESRKKENFTLSQFHSRPFQPQSDPSIRSLFTDYAPASLKSIKGIVTEVAKDSIKFRLSRWKSIGLKLLNFMYLPWCFLRCQSIETQKWEHPRNHKWPVSRTKAIYVAKVVVCKFLIASQESIPMDTHFVMLQPEITRLVSS